jgi:hypothetical protein
MQCATLSRAMRGMVANDAKRGRGYCSCLSIVRDSHCTQALQIVNMQFSEYSLQTLTRNVQSGTYRLRFVRDADGDYRQHVGTTERQGGECRHSDQYHGGALLEVHGLSQPTSPKRDSVDVARDCFARVHVNVRRRAGTNIAVRNDFNAR